MVGVHRVLSTVFMSDNTTPILQPKHQGAIETYAFDKAKAAIDHMNDSSGGSG